MAIYISYSHEDKNIANKISASLRQAQLEVRWDKTELSGGEQLFQKLQGLVMQAECIIALVTENSLSRLWVTTELKLARNLGIKVLLILVGISTDELPNNLKFYSQSLPLEVSD